ncbi:Hpt domain-containing response regulator [Blastococcus sp. VKM Ac-2987]|uniref:Hpt domain-containing response regulator n=1 Tax=Blastococcus sp. VKM Ac-2987 TaxID=3004141 RepID=UPI0022ABBE91|nr:response regulator [Blastococcus sp. VKM Ac-2987]MCZ2858967.1 response regulator [Blastococcus sp. VKM Ac-2987]
MVKVLVVEDEDTTRLMLERRLTWAGYRVRVADSADDALAAVGGAFTPDVVVTDMFMPGGSGLSLVTALRADPGCAELPVIFLSGRALPGDVSAGRSLGATYLAKPCALADLAQAIDAAAGATTDELEDVVRRRLGDVAGVEEEAERAFTARLLRTFVAAAPAGLAALERAAATADAAGVEAAAHRLAGGAGTLGADALAAACRSLEERGREGDVADVAAAVGTVAEQLARTCEVFAGLAEELEEDVLVVEDPAPVA